MQARKIPSPGSTMANVNIERHRQTINEMFKPIRVNFPRRRTEIRSIADAIQADLADMQLLAAENRGYRYILLAVNPFSKYFYAHALKTKNAVEVGNAMKRILLDSGINYQSILTDRGTEFDNEFFKREIERAMGIRHFYAWSSKKAAIVERGIKTLKLHLYREMAQNGSKEWVRLLQPLIAKINATKISRLGFAPNDVTPQNENAIYQAHYASQRPVGIPKYRIGQKVRRAEAAIQFRRSFYPGWSPQIYTIRAVNRKIPTVYRLKDHMNRNINGSYYDHELQIAKYPNYYLIEEILERRGNRLRIKWLGYNETRWVNRNDVYDASQARGN